MAAVLGAASIALAASLGTAWPAAAATGGNSLSAGQVLHAGQDLVSAGGEYTLDVQTDGNLVVYGNNCVLWASNTAGTGSGNYLAMQGDGNLVVYTSAGKPVWASNTAGTGSRNDVVMQSDGNLVVYTSAGKAVWASKNSGGPTAAETAAANWAKSQVGSSEDSGLCLTFVFAAWLNGANVNLKSGYVNYTISGSTYPQQIWGKFERGTTGTSTPPPTGALVFFNATSGHSIEYSHVMISVGGGEMVSTTDTFRSGVHYETLAQHASSGAWNSYVGWWLPDK
jgi:hypothetical protein